MLLRIAARVELATLALLLLNLVTVHRAAVSSLLGPTHGAAYLVVILATWQATSRRGLRLLAFVPGVGGVLVLRRTPRPSRPQTQSMPGTTR
ncbi:DUF3817 domain-containing protein [Jidongwangia harbinensis]|uniref:DUF3817 domain-containing protein n=1 Tax=Jidongwangia harbinensis TaxID=2878561 RepID=UPI001CD9F559|nr:DUF3817 domain-containing protein [Jidongwangia harbinensis]MCA2213497.1 DUF3817 domain-containing protein [Jidongwangia harbinensis]